MLISLQSKCIFFEKRITIAKVPMAMWKLQYGPVISGVYSRLNNSSRKISISSSLETVNIILYGRKGLCRCD